MAIEWTSYRNMGGRENEGRHKGVKVVNIRKQIVMLECLLFCICSGVLCKHVHDEQSKGNICDVTR
jgi:hypothetical protein